MHVPDKNNQPAKIPQLSPSEAWRTLGVHLTLDGNNVDELWYLLEVAKSWQTSMSAAKVTHVSAEFGLRQVVLRKLKYPLIATTLMRTECNTIMSPILSAGLPSAGLTRTFPRAMVHGPWQWGASIFQIYSWNRQWSISAHWWNLAGSLWIWQVAFYKHHTKPFN